VLSLATRACRVLEPAGRRRIARFLAGRQTDDGGFANRAGHSDLYYTVFGLAALAALGRRARRRPLDAFLARHGTGDGLDFVHLTCLVRCRQLRRLLAVPRPLRGLCRRLAGSVPGGAELVARLGPFRSADGGWNQAGPGRPHTTAYAAFLAAQAHDDAGLAMPEPERLLDAIASCRSADGGYANEGGRAAGSTSATAATLWLHRRFGRPAPTEVQEWLIAQAAAGGGFRATPEAPGPDLLSTATALFALQGNAPALALLRLPCLRFIDSLWDDTSGGFRGHADDACPDAEYTFYALLALGACRT
jgi:prenyltransferase beta subunit